MQTYTVNRIIASFEAMRMASPLPSNECHMVVEVLNYAISNGFLTIAEHKNTYTFGGITARLTDTELADIMRCVSNNMKVSGIKLLRCNTGNSLTLKEAKDFVDHLNVIVQKMATG